MRLRSNIASGATRRQPHKATTAAQRPGGPARLLSRLLDVLILSAAGALLVYCLLLTGSPKVTVNDTSYHPQSIYQATVGKDSGFFHKTKLTYNGNAIASKLQKQFPEVVSTSLRLSPFSTSPTFKLNISRPSFVIKSASSTYVMDREGVAVISTTSINLRILKNLHTISDQSGLVLKPGVKVLSSADINFVNEVLAQAKAAKVPVLSLSLPPLSRELDLKTSDEPYLVKFYLGGDSLLQVGQFLAARHSFAQKHVNPSHYLDVRVTGKIFFR